MDTTISLAETPKEYDIAAKLFNEYAVAIAVDLSFQHFEEELDTLQNTYSKPNGGILLCRVGHEYTGCIAVRKAKSPGEGIAELKRMYTRPGCQGKGIGKLLLNAAINLAIECGYKKIWLDTLNHMHAAIHLYRQNGFYEIAPYYHNPLPAAVYFEKVL